MTEPLLLLGAQRSGTTALAHVLSEAYAAMGGIFTVNGKLPYVLARWCTRADLACRHFRADEISHALHRKPPGGIHAARWLGNLDRVLRDTAAEVARGEHTDPVSTCRHVIEQAYADWPCWGDKYNEYLLDLPGLLDVLPRPRVILLVRHPLEAAASQLEWTGDRPWRPSSTADACRKWAAWHASWLESADRIAPERRLVVDYHELCSGAATERLSAFTGLELSGPLNALSATRPSAIEEPSPEIAAVWRTLRHTIS
ncbi:sulfotransferase [Streptosporangium amethystogenes]|uniref:sulfotransferase n=1 Tax=Streptosporangium amethystogenes TaxID=2002 RepID=UPI0004CABE50|nr:sulfotransferase [Streptosporangium amethystogenes]